MDSKTRYLRLLMHAVLGSHGTEHDNMPGNEKELQELLQICKRQGTGPLIYNELLKSPSDIIPAQVILQMKQTCLNNMLLQTEWEKIITQVWAALEGKVQAVLMKGFSYAALYPLPYLRAWGDLDIWVGTEHYHEACGILRNAFPNAKHHDEEWEELKHYCFVFQNGMAIELHRVSMDFLSKKDQAYWNRLTESALSADGKKLQIGEIHVPVFEGKYDLLFCFLHSWEHFCGTGIPLKQVCDMVLLAENVLLSDERSSVDAYLETHLKALRMLDVWKYYGYMACKVFDLPLAEWPLLSNNIESKVKKYGERLYQQVMQEGQCRRKDYGEVSNRYAAREHAKQMNIVSRKMLTLKGRIEKARFQYYFAPKYACYTLLQEIRKGIRRTVRREKMIDY